MLKLKYLKYFQVAADTGRFSAAAKQLNVSASSIGYAIDKLEQSLNTSLFVRKSASGITLTLDGQALLAKCKHVLINIQDIEDSFSGNRNKVIGTLVVGCQEGLTWSLLPRAIKQLAKQHPDLQIIMKTVWMEDKFKAIDKGEIDILITFLVGELPSKTYSTTLLCQPTTCAMMRKNHPLDNKSRTVSLMDAAKYPQIMINDGPAFSLFYGMYENLGLAPPIAMHSNISTGAQAIVGQSDAISLRILQPAHHLSPLGDKIIFPKVKEVVARPNLVAVTRKTRTNIAQNKQDAFIKICEELFNSGEMRKHIYY